MRLFTAITVTVILIVVISPVLYATIINIPDDYSTIQEGINASESGDTVLVQPGTYVENIILNGHNIVLGSLFLMTGDTSYIGQTTIDGDSAGSVVAFRSGSTTEITGFTIQNGKAINGGGIYCLNSNPQIFYNVINLNAASDTTLASGGGIYCNNSSIELKNNKIKNNLASSYGGGIYCFQSNSIFNNNVIYRNSASRGGGMACHSSDLLLINNTVTENTAISYGGGIYGDNSYTYILNSIFWANSTHYIGHQYHFFGGIPLIFYCDIQGGWEDIGNIDINPLFRDPENEDFHLMAINCGDTVNSPCIDAGHPDIIDSLLDCSWGLGTINSDIGAFGGCDSIPHEGRIINVPGDYPTIQLGINASGNGDTVLVQPGIYPELINIYMKYIVLGSLFLTTNDSSYIFSTIIEDNFSGAIITIQDVDDITACIIGFTIRYGRRGIQCHNSNPTICYNNIYGNYRDGDGLGGGIYLSSSNATIIGNKIENNILEGGYTYGGGIYSTFSNAYIANNLICGNSARIGGGIDLDNSSPIIIQNHIQSNSAESNGGGINSHSLSNPEITDNVINENTAQFGGGIYCDNSNLTISNNTLNENEVSGDYYWTAHGGGIYCTNSNAIINDNIITGNISQRDGGGIYFSNSSPTNFPTICNNIITNNSGRHGGGIKCLAVDAVMIDNEIKENYAVTIGGGISGCGTIINCEICWNVSGGNGGGINYNGNSEILKNAISFNVASSNGGGIYCSGNLSMNNNTIYRNRAAVGGGLYYAGFYTFLTLKNTILWENIALHYYPEFNFPDSCEIINITYCDIQDTLWPGEGNIDADPLFVDPDNGDFHLQPGSPCIDAGDPDSPLDPDSTRADIGAFYFDQTTDMPYIRHVPSTFSLSPNYPNPFNASTTIGYSLPHPSDVTLDIYDILGRKVQTLYNGNQPAGSHAVIWNADGFSSGVYFYKLTAGEYKQTQKMVLLK